MWSLIELCEMYLSFSAFMHLQKNQNLIHFSTEVESIKVQMLCYCTEVDFPGICAFLEFSFF